MIVGLFSGLASIGGIQTAGRQMAAALSRIAAAEGAECALLSLSDAAGGHEISAAGTTFSVQTFDRRKPAFVMAALQLAADKPDLIFAAHPNLGPIVSAMKLIARNARVIIGVHGVEIWRPLSFLRRRALRHADLVFAPSSNTALKLANVQSVSESSIRKLAWPLDAEFLELARHPSKLQPPAGFPTGHVILSVARWSARERYKGADLLIHAVPRLYRDFPDVHLVLVGPGDDVPRLKQEAQTCGASAQIHFFTAISRGELAACYANSDIFALPSTGEGFGLVFLEAMAFGKPVLGTNAGGIPDIVRHGSEGLLVSATADAVSEALSRLLSSPDLRRDLGQRGQERVQGEFSFASFQRHLSDSISDLLSASAQRVELAAR